MTQSEKAAGPPPVDGGLAILLARTGRRMLRVVGAEMAPFQVSLNQYIVLARLAAGGEGSAGALAREIDIGSGAMTRLIDRMEELRLIERRADQDDRRVVRLHLTTEGRRILAALNAAVLRAQAKFAQGHTDDDLERFARYLRAAFDQTFLPQEEA